MVNAKQNLPAQVENKTWSKLHTHTASRNHKLQTTTSYRIVKSPISTESQCNFVYNKPKGRNLTTEEGTSQEKYAR